MPEKEFAERPPALPVSAMSDRQKRIAVAGCMVAASETSGCAWEGLWERHDEESVRAQELTVLLLHDTGFHAEDVAALGFVESSEHFDCLLESAQRRLVKDDGSYSEAAHRLRDTWREAAWEGQVEVEPGYVDKLYEAVASEYGVTTEGLRGRFRHEPLKEARSGLVLLLSELTTDAKVGALVGGRAGPVINGIKQKARARAQSDGEFALRIRRIRDRMAGKGVPDLVKPQGLDELPPQTELTHERVRELAHRVSKAYQFVGSEWLGESQKRTHQQARSVLAYLLFSEVGNYAAVGRAMGRDGLVIRKVLQTLRLRMEKDDDLEMRVKQLERNALVEAPWYGEGERPIDRPDEQVMEESRTYRPRTKQKSTRETEINRHRHLLIDAGLLPADLRSDCDFRIGEVVACFVPSSEGRRASLGRVSRRHAAYDGDPARLEIRLIRGGSYEVPAGDPSVIQARHWKILVSQPELVESWVHGARNSLPSSLANDITTAVEVERAGAKRPSSSRVSS